MNGKKEKKKKEARCRPGWDSPYRRLTDVYISVGHLHRTVLERRLNRTGVYRSQHQLLMCIADNPGVSQKRLAQIQHVSSATVAVSLKKLENGGYISRVADEKDNRYNQICITGKGQAVVEKSICCFREVERQMYEGFSEEELDLFFQYLERVRRNLEKSLEKTEEEE